MTTEAGEERLLDRYRDLIDELPIDERKPVPPDRDLGLAREIDALVEKLQALFEAYLAAKAEFGLHDALVEATGNSDPPEELPRTDRRRWAADELQRIDGRYMAAHRELVALQKSAASDLERLKMLLQLEQTASGAMVIVP